MQRKKSLSGGVPCGPRRPRSPRQVRALPIHGSVRTVEQSGVQWQKGGDHGLGRQNSRLEGEGMQRKQEEGMWLMAGPAWERLLARGSRLERGRSQVLFQHQQTFKKITQPRTRRVALDFEVRELVSPIAGHGGEGQVAFDARLQISTCVSRVTLTSTMATQLARLLFHHHHHYHNHLKKTAYLYTLWLCKSSTFARLTAGSRTRCRRSTRA